MRTGTCRPVGWCYRCSSARCCCKMPSASPDGAVNPFHMRSQVVNARSNQTAGGAGARAQAAEDVELVLLFQPLPVLGFVASKLDSCYGPALPIFLLSFWSALSDRCFSSAACVGSRRSLFEVYTWLYACGCVAIVCRANGTAGIIERDTVLTLTACADKQL